jgi:GDP-mannose 6-dehydrogenase
MTTVGVFGLGYVGAVTVAVLAEAGHQVIGVDPNPAKVDAIASGRSPVVEAGLEALIAAGVAAGRIVVTTDPADAMAVSDLSIVCVGTPSNGNGSLDVRQVEKVCQDIGSGLARHRGRHVVVVRSTLLPGGTAGVVVPALEAASGLRAGRDFGVAFNPEFLREGTSLQDFYQPPFTVIGTGDETVARQVAELYPMVHGEVLVVPVAVAETIKYASNAYHALKVTFANEIGALCKAIGVDGQLVMDTFTRDRKLNVSAAYLRPGFAFGGSCLPKDLRALTHHARNLDVATPLLDAVVTSNRQHLERAFELVRATGRRRIGVLGFSFKAGTDDLRESPIVELIERLIGKGYDVSILDRNVSLARLHGLNRAYIEREIPHVASLMCDDVDRLLDRSDVVVIGNEAPEAVEVLARARPDHVVIDLVGHGRSGRTAAAYVGICW